MATQDYDYNDPGIFFGGPVHYSFLTQCRFEFSVKGTALKYNLANNAGTLTVTVDGGSPTVIDLTPLTPGLNTAASGLSDTTHDYVIVNTGGLYETGTFQATSASPDAHCTRPAGKDGVIHTVAPALTYVQFDAPTQIGTASSYQSIFNQSWGFKGNDGKVYRFRSCYNYFLVYNLLVTSAGNIYVYMAYLAPNGLELLVDDVQSSIIAAPGDTPHWVELFTSTTATAVDTSKTWTDRRSFYHTGDSIALQHESDFTGMGHKISNDLSVGVSAQGSAGGIVPDGTPYPLAYDQVLLSGWSDPDVIAERWGTNNVSGANATSVSTFKTNLKSYLTDIRTNQPDAIILSCVILPRNGVDVSLFNVAKQEAVSELTIAGDDNLFYFDDSAGFDPAIHTEDGLHPNVTGLAILATNREGLWPYSLVDLTPPTLTSATINSAGTTLTLVFSEAVTGVDDAVDAGDFRLSTGQALSGGATADGGITWTMTCALVTALDAPTLRYLDGDGFVADLALNLLAAITAATVTNNSTINVPGAPVLDAITGLEVGSTGILVEPTAPVSNGGSTILTYKFYRKRIGIDSVFKLAKTLAAADLASHWLDTGTATDDVVDYKVTAVNAVGEGAASATREATSQGPHAAGWIATPSGSGLSIGISIGL